MKILVCTDGSKESGKALEEAVRLAGSCSINEVAVIHVYEGNRDRPVIYEGYTFNREEMEELKKLEKQEKEKRKDILTKAGELFARNHIPVKTIFKEGHPAQTIAAVANEEGYDIIVIGSRGLGGLKQLFLGSVSNAVLHEARTNVLVVK